MLVCFGKRLADCCGYKNVVTSSLANVKDMLMTLDHDEIGRCKSARQSSSIPKRKLGHMKKYTELLKKPDIFQLLQTSK